MQTILDALASVTEATAEDAINEHCGPEFDRITAEVADRLRRLGADGTLSDAVFASAERELVARLSAVSQRFAAAYLGAVVDAAMAVDEAGNS